MTTEQSAGANSYEMTIAYDGLGNEAKRTQRLWDAENSTYGPWESKYFIYSSVFGRTLTEAGNTGSKWRTLVIADGQSIARQAADDENHKTVGFEYRDASGYSARSSVTSILTQLEHARLNEELDALGNNVGVQAISTPQPRHNQMSPIDKYLFDSTGNECSWDGILGACDDVAEAYYVGAAVICPDNDCGPRVVTNGRGERRVTRSYTAGVDGSRGWWVRRSSGNQVTVNGEPPTTYPRVDEGWQWVPDDSNFRDFFVVTTKGGTQSFVYFKGPVGARSALQDILQGECGQMLSKLLGALKETDSRFSNPLRATDMLALFDSLMGQEEGGIFLNLDESDFRYITGSTAAAGGGGGLSYAKPKNGGKLSDSVGAYNYAFPFRWYYLRESKMTSKQEDSEQIKTIRISMLRLIHEILHNAGSTSTFEEAELDAAAEAIAPNLKKAQPDSFSVNTVINKYCTNSYNPKR